MDTKGIVFERKFDVRADRADRFDVRVSMNTQKDLRFSSLSLHFMLL